MVINTFIKKYFFVIPAFYLIAFTALRFLHAPFFDSFFINALFEFIERFFLNPYMILVFLLIVSPKKMLKGVSYSSILYVGIVSLIVFYVQWLFWPFFWHSGFVEGVHKGVFIARVSFSFMTLLLVIQYLLLSLFKKYNMHKWISVVILCIPALLVFWGPALLSVLFMFAA